MERKRTQTKARRIVPAPRHKEPTNKTERLEARVSPDIKALFERAASIQQRSLTDFVISSATEAARRTVRENEFVELSQRDRIAFVEALINPPPPVAHLRRAMKRHERVVAEE